MPDNNALSDLTVRTRQLEEHLKRSPEYRARAKRRVMWSAIGLAIGVVTLLGEGVIYTHEPKEDAAFTLGSIDFTALLAVMAVVVLVRTKMNLGLNKRWLTPEARKALDGLRREHAEMAARATSRTGTA